MLVEGPARHERVARRTRSFLLLASMLSATFCLLAVAIVWVELRDPAEWNPLGPYPTQEVVTPTVHITGIVTVEAVKCSNEHVTVEGRMSWQAIDPPGANIEVGRGVGEREEGCTRQRFSNPIPAEVREAIRAQMRSGVKSPIWRITGVETPVRGDERGVPRVWVTDNFRVVG